MSSSGRPLGLPGRLPEPDESHRLEAQPPPAGVWIDWGPALPEAYAQDRVKLLVRDPWCLFAYWELTGPHAEWVPRDHGADIFARSKWLVRLFADGALELETPAAHPLGAHYFTVEPERRYRAEVGLLTSAGAWIRVASDGDIPTPRAGIAPIVDDDWAVTEEEMLRQLGMTLEQARARAELLRQGGQFGYPPPPPGPGSSS